MKIVRLTHGIRIELSGQDTDKVYRTGEVTSDLLEEVFRPPQKYKSAVGALETMLLSCARFGVNVESPEFLEALETTIGLVKSKYGG